MDDEGRRGGRARSKLHPPPTPINLLILIVDRPSGTNLFPSSAFRSIKIKDGGYNFREENTEHTLAKITPTQQASMTLN